jgi:hypothetical protein
MDQYMERDKSVFSSGALYPSSGEIRKIVKSLQKKVKEDKEVAKLFKKDPRRTIAQFGVNEDVQNQLLREMNLTARASLRWCVCTSCCKTCWTSACCLTRIVIVIE